MIGDDFVRFTKCIGKLIPVQGTRGFQAVGSYEHREDRPCQWDRGRDHRLEKKEQLRRNPGKG